MKKKTVTSIVVVFFILFLSGCVSSKDYHQALLSALPQVHDASDFDFQGTYYWLANTGSMAPVVPYFPQESKETIVGYLRFNRSNYEDLKPYMTVIRETKKGELVMHQIIRHSGNKWVMKGFANFYEDEELLTSENFQGVVTDVFVINSFMTSDFILSKKPKPEISGGLVSAVLTRK